MFEPRVSLPAFQGRKEKPLLQIGQPTDQKVHQRQKHGAAAQTGPEVRRFRSAKTERAEAQEGAHSPLVPLSAERGGGGIPARGRRSSAGKTEEDGFAGVGIPEIGSDQPLFSRLLLARASSSPKHWQKVVALGTKHVLRVGRETLGVKRALNPAFSDPSY